MEKINKKSTSYKLLLNRTKRGMFYMSYSAIKKLCLNVYYVMLIYIQTRLFSKGLPEKKKNIPPPHFGV